MNKESPIAIAETLLDSLRFEKEYVSTQGGGVSKAAAAVQTFSGSGLDRASCDTIRAAVIDENSEFSVNPRLGCLKLALIICLDPNPARARSFVQSEAIPSVTEEQKQVLSTLYYMLSDTRYSDSQLFSNESTQADPELQKLRLYIAQCTRSVKMLHELHYKLQQYYRKALADIVVLRHSLNEEDTLNEVQTSGDVAELETQISIMENAIANSRVVFMDKISYPARVAEFTCGNCGAKNPASNIFRSRIHAADEEGYSAAQQCLLGQKQPSYIEQSILHDVCLYMPAVCTCGYVNVPNEMFLKTYKYSVLRRWVNMPPKKFSNKAIITYGADIVSELTTETMDCLPLVVEEITEDELPEVQYKDIFSSQTYDAYISSLELQTKGHLLNDLTQRRVHLLKYLISRLNIYSIGYSERDFLLTCIQRFASANFTFNAKEYVKVGQRIADLKVILAVVSNECFTQPFTAYSDIFLSTDYVKGLCLRNSEVPCLVDLLEGKYDNMSQRINREISDLETRCQALLQTLKAECIMIRKSLQEYLAGVKGPENLNRPVVTEGLFTIHANRTPQELWYTYGIGGLLWDELQDLYVPSLLDTLVSSRRVLYKTPLLRRVFRLSSKTAVKKIMRDICSMVGARFVSEEQSQDEMLKVILTCCLDVKDMDLLAMATGINRESLLKVEASEVPSVANGETLFFYGALNNTYYSNLANFAKGATIDEYAECIKASRLEEGNDDSSELDAYSEAEVAAAFYLICTNDSSRSDLNAISTSAEPGYTNTFYTS